MIDQIYARRPDRVDPRMAEFYSPERAILAERLQNGDASRLTVLFPPWHGGGKYVERLTARLANQSAVLDFDFHDRILEPNVERVVQSYQYVQQTASARIEQLVQERGYEQVRLIGMSLGNVAMGLVASQLSDFTEATIIAGSSNLAKSMWEGIKTQQIKQNLENQGVTINQLDDAWRGLALATHITVFKGKKVKMQVATRDTVIPTVYQRELLADLQVAGADVTPRHLRMGHYAATALFYYFGK